MSQPVILEVTRADKDRRRILIPVSSILYVEDTVPAVIVMRTARIEVMETYDQIRSALAWDLLSTGGRHENKA